MRSVWEIIKKSTTDLWDEMLYMLLFNVIWLIGTVLIIPWPFVTFGLFHIAAEVSEANGIRLSKFINYGRQMAKPAYIWGVLNLIGIALLWFNVTFYSGYTTQWAAILQLFFLSILAFWLLTMHLAVGMYPRLIEPSFGLALRNAAILVGRNQLVVLVIMLFIGLILFVSVLFPALLFLMTFS